MKHLNTPAKAFGAVGRSKQLIVIGDEPATSYFFFQKADNDIEEDLDIDVDESTDLALGVWRNPRMLMALSIKA